MSQSIRMIYQVRRYQGRQPTGSRGRCPAAGTGREPELGNPHGSGWTKTCRQGSLCPGRLTTR